MRPIFLACLLALAAPLAASAAPAEVGEPPDPPAEIIALSPNPEDFTPRTEAEIIDEWIDVHGQYAMKRLSEREAVGPRMWSRVIPAAIKRRTLEGIYIENQAVPALRAREAGGNWWEILEEGEAVVCYKVPADQRPILVMDDGMRSNGAILDRALVVAFQECGFGSSSSRTFAREWTGCSAARKRSRGAAVVAREHGARSRPSARGSPPWRSASWSAASSYR